MGIQVEVIVSQERDASTVRSYLQHVVIDLSDNLSSRKSEKAEERAGLIFDGAMDIECVGQFLADWAVLTTAANNFWIADLKQEALSFPQCGRIGLPEHLYVSLQFAREGSERNLLKSLQAHHRSVCENVLPPFLLNFFNTTGR
jgi:hypothetical protein